MNAVGAINIQHDRRAEHCWVKSILLATDCSEASAKSLHQAIGVARHYGASLYLTHVVYPSILAVFDSNFQELRTEAVCKQTEGFLRIPEIDDISHELMLRKGEIWEELERTIAEKKVDLIVVGTDGRQGLRKLVIGSVAEQIFRRATCPVLTVGPRSIDDPPLENAGAARLVLFATDFGPASLSALKYAISFASMHNGKLVLMHVVPIFEIPEKFRQGWIYSSDVTEWREEARLTSLRRLQELVSETNGLPFAPEFMVEFGLPAEKILWAANSLHADVIVMGLRPAAHINSASHLPWATAYEVVCGATCPVLTTRR
jgi:nucleotide-binding universal stress UspA family protein